MLLESIDHPSGEMQEAVFRELRTHNQSSSPQFWEKLEQPEQDPVKLNLFAFHEEDRSCVLGGLFATTQFSWLKIEIMAVVKEKQGSGIGTALMKRAEEMARHRGCRYAFTDTMEHQAPGFYQGLGYEVAGKLEDWDSHGHAKYFLRKDLEA